MFRLNCSPCKDAAYCNLGGVMRKILFLTFVLSFCSTMWTQLPTATLNGTVTDPQGAVVAGATVAIINSSTGVSREITTGSDGGFAVTDLAPGEYTVRVRASGF